MGAWLRGHVTAVDQSKIYVTELSFLNYWSGEFLLSKWWGFVHSGTGKIIYRLNVCLTRKNGAFGLPKLTPLTKILRN